MITFESGLKNNNKWISITNEDVEPLRLASIKSLLDTLEAIPEVTHYPTVCWSFDKAGNKNGYKVTIHIEPVSNKMGETSPIEVVLTSKYPWLEQRIFKTLCAAERFILNLGYQDFRVDMG